MNELVKQRNETYTARYEVADPYAAFANENGPGIVGRLIACRKGDWGIGSDKAPIPPEARFLFIVPEIMRGWLKWREDRVVDSAMGFVRDGFPVKHRAALDDTDEESWERLSDGSARDPWVRTFRALLIECSPPHGDATLSGSSEGLRLALQEICRVYSAEAAQHPGCFPVVGLTTRTRPNKNYGPIKGPWFDVHGWTSVEDIRSGRKTPAALAKPKPKAAKAPAKPAETPGEALDDEIPNWGN